MSQTQTTTQNYFSGLNSVPGGHQYIVRKTTSHNLAVFRTSSLCSGEARNEPRRRNDLLLEGALSLSGKAEVGNSGRIKLQLLAPFLTRGRQRSYWNGAAHLLRKWGLVIKGEGNERAFCQQNVMKFIVQGKSKCQASFLLR